MLTTLCVLELVNVFYEMNASSKKTLTLLVFCGTFGSQTKYMYMFPNLSLFLLGQLKSPLEAGQVSSTRTCHSIGDGLGPAGLELNCKSMGENTMKTEPTSPLAELQEISTVAGSYLELT